MAAGSEGIAPDEARRKEELYARRLLERLLPEGDNRVEALALLAEAIEYAHRCNASGWCLSLQSHCFRLNVGMLAVCSLYGYGVSLCIDGSDLDTKTREMFGARVKLTPGSHLLPGALWADFRYENVAEIYPLLRHSHEKLIEACALSQKRTTFWRAHRPGAMTFLAGYLNRPSLPQPAYYVLPRQARDIPRILVESLSWQGLRFSPTQLAAFYTALQTKGFVILSGISGTGKTKLAQHFATLLPQPSSHGSEGPTEHTATDRNHLFVSVRPDWRDGKSLLGYYNPLTGTYAWTPFLRFLLRAAHDYTEGEDRHAWFAILDEMNLARVEYYFSDLLSVLESGRDEDGLTREPLRLDYPTNAKGDEWPPKELFLPPNLYIIGTVNIDETTHAFSPKVLDRAFTMELTDVDLRGYPQPSPDSQSVVTDEEGQALFEDFSANGEFARIDKEAIAAFVQEHLQLRDRLQNLNTLLRPYDLHFGYRVFDEIVSYLINAERSGVYGSLGGAESAFDAAVLMKVLPKFHGSRARLEPPLQAVLAWCINPEDPDTDSLTQRIQDQDDPLRALDGLTFRFPQTAARVQRMLRALHNTGFAAFA